MDEQLRKTGFVVVAENQTKGALQEIKADAADMAAKVEQAGQRAGQGLNAIGDGGEQAARKLAAFEKSWVNSVERATVATTAGEKGTSKYFEAWGRYRGVGGDVLEPLIAKLRDAEAAQAAASASMGNMGKSAKELQFAMRGVPAQISDIVVSLQGGQAPMTVFMQQGLQLRDMFGGFGAAGKALGSTLIGIVNPLTVAGAAVVALGAAYNAGSKEADAYRKSITLTGNAAGTTVGQLQEMATRMGAVAGGQREAAQALAVFVSEGKVATANLEAFTRTAVEFSNATGKSVGEVAQQFSDLARDPLTATLKLNDSMNYLTESVFRQIKALQDQGRATEAADLAQKTYAQTLDSRKDEIIRNLGSIEKAWRQIKLEAGYAMDAFLDIGRARTLETRLAKAQKALDDYTSTLPGRRTTETVAAVQGYGGEQGLRNEIAGLQELIDAQRRSAEMERQRGEAVKASGWLAQEATKHESDLERKRRAVAEATVNYQEALKNDTLTQEQRNQLEREYLAIVTGITAEKEKGAKAKAGGSNKELAEQAKLLAELSGLSADFYKNWQRLNDAFASGTIKSVEELQRQQAALLAKQPAVAAQAREQAAATRDAARAAQEGARSHEQYIAELSRGATATQRQIDALRQEEQARAVAAASNISLAEAVELVAIARLKEQQIGMMGNEDAVAAIQREIDARYELLGLLGSKAARDANKKAADEAAKDWERTAQTISDTLADYIMGGGKDAAQYLKRLFATLVLQPQVQMLVGGLMGTGPAAAAGGAGGMLNGLANSGGGLTNWGTWGTGGADWLWNSGAEAINRGWTTLGGNMMDLGRTVGQVDTWLRDIPGFGGGIGSAAGYLGAIYSLGQGKPGSAIGQAIGTYIMPGIGTFIGGMLGGFLDGLDDSGTPHIGGSAAWSSSQGLRTNLGFLDDQEGLPGYNPNDNIDNQFGSGMPWVQDNEQVRGTLGVMAQTIASTLDSFAKAFGQQAGYDVALGFADDSSKDGSWGALRIALGDRELLNWNDDRESKWAPRIFSDGEQGWKEFTAATAQDLRDVMTEMDIPGWVKDSLEGLGDSFDLDALGAVVTQIGAVNTAFDALGFGVAAFADLTDEARGKLIQESGGLQGFAASASNYYDKFYTDDEKQAFKEDALSKEMERLGLQMPKTREEFRAMVEAQLALGESGAEAAAQLMGLSNAAYDVLPAAEEAADSIRTFADAAKESFGITADTVKGLLDDILENAGSAGEARQMGAAGFEDMMLSAMMNSLVGNIAGIVMQQIVTPMVTGAAMQASLQTMGAAVSASTLAAGGAAAGAANAAGGGAAAQILVEGGIGAATAMISGGEAVGQTVSAATEAARAQMQQYRDIMRDPAFREMIEEGRDIFGDIAADLFDFKGSIGGGLSSVGGSFGGAASAADALADSLKNMTSVYEDEIKRLRGINESESPSKGYDALMSQFATATAAARAGDEDARGLLPGLSKQIDALLPDRAASSAELALMRGWLAGSLAETLKAFADADAAKSEQKRLQDEASARGRYEGGKYFAWLEAGSPLGGWSDEEYEDWYYRKYLGVPALATGTNYVPQDMLAMLHKGEAVVPERYNPAAGGPQIVAPQAFTQPLWAGESRIVEALREEFAQLREENRALALEAQRLRLRLAQTQERTEGLIAMQEE